MDRLLLCLMVLFLAGCGKPSQNSKDVVAQVGCYVITHQEFQDAYKNSSYGAYNTASSRRAFLSHMINQKLILLDALKRGMDKDKDFLKMIENYWQQSLITADLRQKTKEVSDLDTWLEYLKANTKITINQESLQ